MRIGELAREAGVNTKTIRYYEDTGVLPEPGRESNGYRTYGSEAVERLRFVRDAQSAGLSLDEITTILDLRDSGEGTCHHTQALMEGHLADVELQIEDLKRTRDRLVRLTERARSMDPSECNDPNRCQTIPSNAR